VTARDEVRRRSGGLCEARIADDCTVRADHMHHIARRWNGADTADNLAHLCFVCHGFLHNNVALALKLGFLKRSEPLKPVVNTKGNGR
jgi:HNH endonuclease